MTAAVPMPTDQMKFNVAGDARDETYLHTGQECFVDIKAIAADMGSPVETAKSVLDFGRGCARVLRNWPLIEGQSVVGTDIDGDAIAWCRTALPRFGFQTNRTLPPADFPAKTFNLIYSISVFSHLRPDYAAAWVRELQRIAAPGAVLIVSLHGTHLLPQKPRLLTRLTGGIRFEATSFWNGQFPDWYGNIYFSEAAARSLFAPTFKVEKFIKRGMAGHQDVIVLRA